MKTKLFQILGVAAIATIGMASCDTDPCADVTCENNGVCLDGDCVCEDGFGGTDCATDYCAELTCDATGGVATAVTGGCDCVCNEGYEGEDCATLSRDKFLGSYDVTSTCTSGQWVSTIEASQTGVSIVILDEFSHLVCNQGAININATVSGNTLTINEEDCGVTFTGTGTIDGTTLTINLSATYDDGGAPTTDTCVETWVKQ